MSYVEAFGKLFDQLRKLHPLDREVTMQVTPEVFRHIQSELHAFTPHRVPGDYAELRIYDISIRVKPNG